MRIAFLALVLSATQGFAWCTTPVPDARENDRWKGRYAVEGATQIPGYPYLLIGSRGYGLHTIRNGRLEDLETEFPHGGLGGRSNWVARIDGLVWGWRSGKLYEFKPGWEGFRDTGISGFGRQRFDPNRQVMLLWFPEKGLMEWDGESLQTTPFGETQFSRNSDLPVFQPDVGLYLVRPGGLEIYVIHPDNLSEWHEIDFGWWHGPPDYYNSFWGGKLRTDDSGEVVTFHTGRRLYVLKREGLTDLRRDYHLDGYHRIVKDSEGALWSKPTLLKKDAILLSKDAPEHHPAASLPEGHVAKPVRGEYARKPSALFGGEFFWSGEHNLEFRAADGSIEVVEPFNDVGFKARYMADVPGENYGLVKAGAEIFLLHRECPD